MQRLPTRAGNRTRRTALRTLAAFATTAAPLTQALASAETVPSSAALATLTLCGATLGLVGLVVRRAQARTGDYSGSNRGARA